MSGFFGCVSRKECVADVFYGTDYHSHLGTKKAGMAFYNGEDFVRSIHSIENATSKLEATVEQGRYASFRIDQALDHPKASRLVLQQMIASLEEVIGQLFIFEAGSRINTNRYTCLISQFREKQALAKRALEHSDKNNTPEVFV